MHNYFLQVRWLITPFASDNMDLAYLHRHVDANTEHGDTENIGSKHRALQGRTTNLSKGLVDGLELHRSESLGQEAMERQILEEVSFHTNQNKKGESI